MVYERYPRGYQSDSDYGRDYGSGREYTYSSARDYAAAGRLGQNDQRDDRYGRNDGRNDDGRTGYGARGYGDQGSGRRDDYGQRSGYGYSQTGRDSHYREGERGAFGLRNDDDRGNYGARDRGGANYGGNYGARDQGGYRDMSRGDNRQDRGGSSEYHGSYTHDGHRFLDVGSHAHDDDDYYRDRSASRGGRDQRYGREQGRDRDRSQGQYGRQPQGYDYEDRGFLARAGDEVRSWFGDDEAERRREADARYDERAYGGDERYGQRNNDDDYHSWRSNQMRSFDRDYAEYRQENQSKFHNEFASWRTNRQTQRDSLEKVKEHQEVVGSDGSHVGTVDKVRGDRIILTKNDSDAGGRHHSIPSSWLKSVDDKVTLSKTADEAKKAWRDEENNQAMFGRNDSAQRDDRYGSPQSRGNQASGNYGATSQSATGASASSTTGTSPSGTSATTAGSSLSLGTTGSDSTTAGSLNKGGTTSY